MKRNKSVFSTEPGPKYEVLDIKNCNLVLNLVYDAPCPTQEVEPGPRQEFRNKIYFVVCLVLNLV